MWLLVVYPILLLIGELVAIEVGLYLDRVYPPLALPVALTLIFGVLVVAYPPAVWITERWFLTDADRAAGAGRDKKHSRRLGHYAGQRHVE
jgi:hypothetical protein